MAGQSPSSSQATLSPPASLGTMQEPQGSFRRQKPWLLLRNQGCSKSSVWAMTEPACLKISSCSFPKPQGFPPAPTLHPGAEGPLKAIGTVNTPCGGWFMEDFPQLVTRWISHSMEVHAAAAKLKLQSPSLRPAKRAGNSLSTLATWDGTPGQQTSLASFTQRMRAAASPCSRPSTKHRATPNGRLRATLLPPVVVRPAHHQHTPQSPPLRPDRGASFYGKCFINT